MRRLAIASLALATALGVAGCSSTATSTQTPSAAATQSAAVSTAPSRAASVTIHNMAFSPDPVTVSAGATVTWTNQDSVDHTVTFDDTSITSSGNLATGQTFTATFSKPGTYTYHCSIHPNMTGTITVS